MKSETGKYLSLAFFASENKNEKGEFVNERKQFNEKIFKFERSKKDDEKY